jgi:hypothetical protein
VGQRYGLRVSRGQSFKVIAKGVRLKGDPGGFSEFRHRRMYSGDGVSPETEISG